MKKWIIIVFVILLCVFSSFSQAYQTERYAFAQIQNYYNASSWSLVIEEGNVFFETYPFSKRKNEIVYFQAESYFNLGNLTEAQELFEYVLNQPNNESFQKDTYYYLGVAYSRQGEHDKALSYLYPLVQEPFEDTDKNKDILLYSARSLSSLSRHDELMVVIEYYIKQYGENTIPLEMEGLLGNLWLGLGVEAFDNKRFIEALEYFTRADLQKVEGVENPSHYEKSGLYQATIHFVLGDPSTALNILENRLTKNGSSTFEYTALLSIIYREMSNNEKSSEYSKDAISIYFEQPSIEKTKTNFSFLQTLLYWSSVTQYTNRDYIGASESLSLLELSLLEDFGSLYELESSVLLLKAQSMFLSGDEAEALILLEERFPHSDETVKALFLSGHGERASKTALQSDDNYLKGLAYFYNRDWALSYESFSALHKDATKLQDWVRYYMGMSLYYTGDYSESLQIFSSFLHENPYHVKIWDVYFISAVCALQEGQTSEALEHSLMALRVSKSIEQRQTAAVFAAGLYIDEKQYTQANNLLVEFASSNEVSSIAPRLLLSQTYAEMGRIEMAADELEKIIRQFPQETFSREAAYKRGEIFFEAGHYFEAEKYFRDFRLSYSDGIYSDLALYFEAESRNQQNDSNGAILLYTDLLERYTDSSYRFASISKVVVLHREIGEYGIALEFAQQAQIEYPLDYEASDLKNEVTELIVLASGIDEEIAKILFDWQGAGNNTSAEGRLLGYELSLLYLQNTGETDKAVEILQELNSVLQNTSGEYSLHADVLDTLGRIERENENCELAARYYLQEVESLARLENVRERSEKALYRAIESFECAGKLADANAVYLEMEKNYKDSIWFERASTVLRKD